MRQPLYTSEVMKKQENEFAWSLSRHKIFQECPRQYYYHYYGSRGGWWEDADARTRELYMLKKLTTRHAWIGEHVHDAICSVLKAMTALEPLPRPEEVSAKMLNRMRAQFKGSRNKEYRNNPLNARGFFEHEYDVAVADSEWKQLADYAVACVTAFFSLPLFEKLKNMPRQDMVIIEKFERLEIEGLPILVRPDLAYRDAETMVVCDWKTGQKERPEEHRLQAACYALAACHKWNLQPEQVMVQFVYLPFGRIEQCAPTVSELEETRSFIRESADEMLFPLTDPEHNRADDESAFDFTDNPRVCRACNFLKVCPRGTNQNGSDET